MIAVTALINFVIALATPFAGPYRLLAWKPRTFGGFGTGLLTWFGIFFLYPVMGTISPAFAYCWLALILLAWIKMFAQWCSNKPRRDEGENHYWFGSYELVFATILLLLARLIGSRWFFEAGFVCSLLQTSLVNLRRRLEGWTPEDTERLVRPLRDVAPEAAQVKAGATSAGSIGLSILRYAFWRKPTPVAQGSGVVVYQPLTLTQRVKSHLVAHMIISFFGGALGINVLAAVVSLALALPLWMMGAEVHLPSFATAPIWGLYERVKNGLAETKEKAVERLKDKQEEIKERWHEKKDEVEAEAGRVIRRSVWDSMFNREE